MLTLSLNNESRELPDNTSLQEAIEHWGMVEDKLAAAVNGEFVPRSHYSNFKLSDGDLVDLVKPVGGG
ncbi:sulfur carrier protein ThiS [Pseudomaricurvus alkylphenolicus]|jgi:sulfur carrier protein|uniref:sulfur carrier protein ThiS n=1 Tax=Pseudomaricurvus alkylphenolicus TaxID=1306991 RepID=UPI0014210C4D|nr:sulfur carrier protein ThiS [Pseudomaricurvus alkylphenolicus]NIB44009.1 sulfur carrier protein ThiS [Pseudomaricurvus alkylphenolicus]